MASHIDSNPVRSARPGEEPRTERAERVGRIVRAHLGGEVPIEALDLDPVIQIGPGEHGVASAAIDAAADAADAAIDEASDESFPASDPPSWTRSIA